MREKLNFIIGLTATLIIAVSLLLNALLPDPPPTPTSAPTLTRVPTFTPVPRATVSPPASLADLAASLAGGSSAYRDGIGVITYDGLAWDATALIGGFLADFQRLAPRAFAIEPQLQTFVLQAYGPFQDNYGQQVRQLALSYQISRSVSAKIDWQHVRTRQLGALLDREAGCVTVVHPALRAAYNAYRAGN